MPQAVTHVLLTIILVGFYRDYVTKHKHYFSLYTVLIAGFAGLFPDIDVPLNWIFKVYGYIFPLWQHGGITHTPTFALIFLVPGLLFLKKGKHKMAMYFFVMSFGISFHLFLDWLLGGGGHSGIMFLWPFSHTGWRIGLLTKAGLDSVPQALDAIILLSWLFYIEKKHKISDFV